MAAVISTVQSGTLSGSPADQDVTITAVADLTKTFLVVSYSYNELRVEDGLIRCSLTSTTNIKFLRHVGGTST